MANKNKPPMMSREQAAELYSDLNKAMKTLKAKKNNQSHPSKAEHDQVAKSIAREISKSLAREPDTSSDYQQINESPSSINRGHAYAISFVLLFALTKVAWSALEFSGIAQASVAKAKIDHTLEQQKPQFAKEELELLKKLDQRRVELDQRDLKLDTKQKDIENQERALVTNMAQLRELTDMLKMERDKGEKKKNAQLDQLANVYGAMTPQEAAKLIEQLDVAISLSLLERMPEKRVGQILAIMSPEKALTITKILSDRKPS